MRIAITGARGFVGSHIIENFKKTDFLIYPISRKFDKNNLLINDLRNKNNWNNELKNIDVLIHCAGIAHVNSKDNLKNIKEVNVEGLRNILRSAIEVKVKRIIYISSIKVYGNYTLPGKFINNKSLISPKDPYGVSKVDAENLIKEMTKDKKMDYVIIRPSLIYGARLKANFLNLIKLLSFPLPIPLPFHAINNQRSFLYIKNLVDFLKLCCHTEKASNKTFVISDKEYLSTKDLINLICAKLNRRHLIFYLPKNILTFMGDLLNKRDLIDRLTLSFRVDPSDTFKDTGFKPKYSIKDGLRETLEWYMNR